ncbi:MAG: hypothetical protein KGI77_05305, partial [Gammaproteobacteria bacterium]|nr:hypothetical protein [Gammaproteobacteria bacterium]
QRPRAYIHLYWRRYGCDGYLGTVAPTILGAFTGSAIHGGAFTACGEPICTGGGMGVTAILER